MAKKRSSSNSSGNSQKNSGNNSENSAENSAENNSSRNESADAAAQSNSEPNSEPNSESNPESGVDSRVDTGTQAELAKRYGPDADSQVDASAGELAQELEGQVAASATAEPQETPAFDAEIESESEPAESEPVSEEQPAPVAKVKTGRGVAWFSLLLALASLGGAGYMYYTLIYQAPLQQLSQQMTTQLTSEVDQALATVRGSESANDDKFAELRKSLGVLRAQQNSALENLATRQAEQLASTEAGLMTSLNKVANAAPPSEAQWKLAELEYLLRIANHRVLMEADANGALQVLGTADAILRELDDFGLHGVRAQLSDEILALKQVRGADIQGLFLRLEALKRQLSELPLRAPEFNAASNQTGAEAVVEGTPATTEPGVLAAMRAKISEYVQFRRLQTPVKPLLGPDETMYLELNLRMMLERAQLAALRQQQEVYSQSLSSAQEWLEQYLDPQSADVAALVGEIDGLLEVDLARELPDISGSLRSLLATQRGSS